MTQVKRKLTSEVMSIDKKPKLITDFFTSTKKPQLPQNLVHEKGAKVNDDTEILSKENRIQIDANDQKSTEMEVTETGKLEITGRFVENDQKNGKQEENIKTTENKYSVDSDYTQFCLKHGFDKTAWVAGLSEEEKQLLDLEIENLHISWLVFLHQELTKPYFLKLKKFLRAQKGKTIFPPPKDIYLWSHYTPLPEIKCLILGQDPYHNYNQAHGLAFLVLEPTKPPPSLVNIYKSLEINFPDFVAPDYKKLVKQGKPGGGNLTKWAKRGVLMLNACLTVEAHKANSHAGQGWEQFTEKVIETAILYARDVNKQGFSIMAWGLPAHKRVDKFKQQLGKTDVSFLVLRSVHPSPLSAYRGFFDLKLFADCNEWLKRSGREPINWGLVEGNDVY